VPTRIRGLAEIVLTTHDMAAALRFYRETLGLEQISPPERPSPVFLKAGEAALGIPQMLVLVQLPADAGAFGRPRALHHLALEVAPADFEAEKARLEGLGFEVRSGQHPVVPSRTIYVDDPMGNEVELICTVPAPGRDADPSLRSG
jgi:catechol 2,3-dioxygenase-like lactoylglutathione lyase family enzyme